MTLLTTTDHSRASANLQYIYPVVSRRAGGVSIGVNLNPNNACNWACVYCQVPDLTRGSAPKIDLLVLAQELDGFLADICHGDFMQTRVPPEARRLNDIALSGNGEPTSAAEFGEVLTLIHAALIKYQLLGQIKVVLITNGSLIHKPAVRAGILQLAQMNGEVWFKLDRATEGGIKQVNQVNHKPDLAAQNLAWVAAHCPTWVQTCVFAYAGQMPDEAEQIAYLNALSQLTQQPLPYLQGVLLYGLARPSLQPQAALLSPAPADWMDAFADKIRALGLVVKVSV